MENPPRGRPRLHSAEARRIAVTLEPAVLDAVEAEAARLDWPLSATLALIVTDWAVGARTNAPSPPPAGSNEA